MLILIAILVTPVISAKNIEIITEEPTYGIQSGPTELKEEYYDMVDKIVNDQLPTDELITLYAECGFEDEDGAVTVYSQIVDIYGHEFANNINVIFGEPPQSTYERQNAMREISKTLKEVKDDNKNIVENCVGAFEDIEENNGISLDDFPADKRDWAEEQYNVIIEDLEGKQYLQPLINKIINSEYLNLPEINLTVLLYCFLYMIALAGVMALPIGDTLVGMVEGAIIGAGFAMLMSEANATKELAKEFEALFGYILPGMDWEAAACFTLGFVAFVIYFTLFKTFRIVRIMGGVGAAVGGCVAIYMYFTLFVRISEWNRKERSVTEPTPLIRVILLKLFPGFASRFKLFKWYSLGI